MNQKGLADDVREALGAKCRATGSVLVQVSGHTLWSGQG